MISIIISSYKPSLVDALKKNIEDTIGLLFEIIVIQNKGLMGISAAYNLGAEKAKYDMLCFIHDDVEFITKNWGVSLVKLFTEDKDLALAGFAGSKYKTDFITGWTTSLEEYDRMNISQRLPDNKVIKHINNPNNEPYSEVITLDGMCLFTTINCWLENKFNEELKGFHFYDLDLSLRFSSKNKKVVVVFFIDIIHLSSGRFSRAWLKEAVIFHQRKDIQSIIKQQPGLIKKKENLRNIKFFWIYHLRDQDIPWHDKLRLYLYNYKILSIKDFVYTLFWYTKLIKLQIHSKIIG